MTLRRHHDARARPAHARTGLTILEVVVCISLVLVAAAIVLGVVGRVRRAQDNISCISTLKSIGGSLRDFALENHGRFPDPGLADKSWEKMLRDAGYTGTFRCNADKELAPVLGSSYDWRDTGLPSTTLAGKTLADVRRPEAVLALEAMPGWHEQNKINVVRIDGSTAPLDADECFGDLQTPIRAGDPALERRNANTGG
jgi:hypothetical protein